MASGKDMAVNTKTQVVYRKPEAKDGARVWELIGDTGTLDLNSAYCYILLGDYFNEGKTDRRVVGLWTI